LNQSGRKGMHDDFESFFENTAVGNIFTSSQGVVLRVNRRLAGWLGEEPDDLIGRRFSDVLTMRGKIYLETHLFPMLRMQGEFEEVMLELKTKSGEKLAALVNGFEQRDAAGTPTLLRFAIVRAKNRLVYEQNLRRSGRQAQEALASAEGTLLDERETAALREQFHRSPRP
jgi:sigma-B regulation protein RsbU (phosphoserine phosphatase)